MPKQNQPVELPKKQRAYYSVHPWQCRHNKESSEIQAYVEASGQWEIVAIVNPTSGASPETMASYLCNLNNESQERQRLLLHAMEALQTCLDESKLTYSAEQAAERVVTRIKDKIG